MAPTAQVSSGTTGGTGVAPVVQIPLRFVVFRQDGWWVAHCLEYDFLASSRRYDDLPRRIIEALEAEQAISEQEGVPMFSDADPAPAKYHQMWSEASREYTSPGLLDRVLAWFNLAPSYKYCYQP